MNADFLKGKHQAGLSYEQYLATGTEQQQENWTKVYNQVTLTDGQKSLLGGFTRQMKVIGLSGIWCGDCVVQGPMLARIAEANPESIDLKWLDRDEHADLQEQVRINAGNRVPVVVFCAEDYELVGWYGDRTLSRYRAIAAKQLGAACPLPGAPLEEDEGAATVSDWINEFERVQLILRLSTRLRKKHGD